VEDLESLLEDLDGVDARRVEGEPRPVPVALLAARDRAAVGVERLRERDELVVEAVVGTRRVTDGVDVDRPPLVHGAAAYAREMAVEPM
jgi:hypothetical protein